MYMAQRDKSKDLKVGDIGSYTATESNVDEGDLVQSRIGGVMNDSNLRNQAIGTATSQAGSRGLINSQMNTQGAVAELYKAALPIASQDSATVTQDKQFNANVNNEAGKFGAEQKNVGIIENIRGQLNKDSIYESGRSQYSNQELVGSQQLAQIAARGDVESKLQTQADSGAMSRLNVSGEQSLDQIEATDLGAMERLGLSGEQALAQILERGTIDINLQSASDLAALERLGISGEQALGQIAAQAEENRATQTQADLAALERQGLSGEQALAQILERGTIDINLQSASDVAALARLGISGEQALAQIEAQGNQEITLETLRSTNDQALQDLRNTNERLISANQAAAMVFSNTQVAVANVLSNDLIPIGQKQGFINILNGELENSLRAIGTFADVDVTGLLPGVDADADAGTDTDTDTDAGSDASNDPDNYLDGLPNYDGENNNDYRRDGEFG